ncbi:hypothetical protein CK500_02320 [Halorubrum salipaludis]|uniref:Uncharacterized protein n=1 Tax=Halorubrum salipaludis TaxID=2032630 RepID=A0A2A2FLU6_9EURY|nr:MULTISPECIES: hypothetical protein [Halorubrum]PAU85525.1 hypothetical protein CK500_02320 [Halorubrum salipaludis]
MDPEEDAFVRQRQRFGEEHITAWEQTLEETDLLAEERREDGWETTVVMVPHTDTVSRDMKEHDRFGLMHVVPNNYADAFVEAYDEEAFSEYLVYGDAIDGVMYVAIELIDPEEERSILVPCKYDMTMAEGMTQSALDEGALYSHFKTISGETLGRFRYEEFEPLVAPPNKDAATSVATVADAPDDGGA